MRPIQEVISGRAAWLGLAALFLLMSFVDLLACHQDIEEHAPFWATAGMLAMAVWGLGFMADAVRRAEAF
jgi:hypothetical protein